MTFDPSEAAVYTILVLDAVVSMVVLLHVRTTCEFCCRRPNKPIIETPPNLQPAGGDLPAGSTSVPQVE